MELIHKDDGKWYFIIDCEGSHFVESIDYDTETEACKKAHGNNITWESWICNNCGQKNSGFSITCGRCEDK